MVDSSRLHLVLGPTNTGKTHRAIECMLTHESGLLGVPLRLLAREIYDRLLPRVGADRIALVTGEERIVPRNPSYVIATVEAMPLGREYDFIAVDEIQLAGHHERGHVFTDRLLHARGRKETWFLGSQTILGVAKRLLRTAQVESYPRLSTLRFAGTVKLSHVPKRSAVVAFSLPEVYATAERLRGIHGGSAVVSGALSPRTRNAQVEMYQRGEVDFLVATDAIGMGLNLDVRHVAFMGLRKFDGRAPRALDATEVAQIAGRAGRALADGTFGTIAPTTAPDELVFAVEAHQFAPLARLWWRNSDLDFASPQALLDSLSVLPPRAEFRHAAGALDMLVLEQLIADPEVKGPLHGSENLQLLWSVCAIPDYRKLLLESHVAQLKWLFLKLVHGPLRDDVVEAELLPLDSVLGEVDTLTARIARTRTWSFIAERPSWLCNPERYRLRTRELEERLSDALHAQLVLRFVDSTKRHRTLAAGRTRVVQQREAEGNALPSGPFAVLAKLRAALPQGANVAAELDAPVTAGAHEIAARVVSAENHALRVDEHGRIVMDQIEIAILVRGREVREPAWRLALLNLSADMRRNLEQRLRRFVTAWVAELLEPVTALAVDGNSDRISGLIYALCTRLGAVGAPAEGFGLTAGELETCRAHDVRVGNWSAYSRRLAQAEPMHQRWLLVRAFCELQGTRAPTSHVYHASDAVASAAQYLGYCAIGDYWVRCDLAERWLGSEPIAAQRVARGLRCTLAAAHELLVCAAEILALRG